MNADFYSLMKTHTGGVFRSHTPLSDLVLEFAVRNKLRVVTVMLAAARDKNAFMNAMATALQFPDYFGHNWDAFYDCLLDLQQGHLAGTLVVLREASAFARAEAEEFAAAMAAVDDAAEYWKTKAKALIAVVELESPTLAAELAEISLPAK
jgi:RNAse (barnase) inhibitor barstar